MTKSGKPSGPRRTGVKKQTLKTARGRKTSSQAWLNRQLNDPYVAMAKQEGYRSRAAYKLLELDERFKLLKPGLRVVDLGAAPGGWTQVAAEKIMKKPDGRETGNETPTEKPAITIIAIDLLPISPLPGTRCFEMDFLEDGAPETIKEALGGKANLVLSDMAPNSSGDRALDHIRIVTLVEAALDFAIEVLTPGGNFLAKVWQGGAEKSLLDKMKKHFSEVKHAKPPSSRKDSAETYVVAKGFKGAKKEKE